jgi:hypothetical protein
MIDSRQQFEQWYKEKYTKNVQRIGDEYVHGATERLWQAWQASRTHCTVDLPIAFDASRDDAPYYLFAYKQSDIEQALDNAGVSYQ